VEPIEDYFLYFSLSCV